MDIPASVKVLGFHYPLEIVRGLVSDGVECVGVCRNRELVIRLDDTYPGQQVRSTLIHEMLEALKEQLQLKIDHTTLGLLEVGINSILVDNPDFVAMYLEAK